MREHEVPTHVQAEDRVLLWLTFPQIVAVTAVCALSYGAYGYVPVDSAGVRIGLAVFLAVVGMAMVVGRIGGRSLPLVAADLLRYRLGARRYAGTASELVRSEPPTPPRSGSGPRLRFGRRPGKNIPSVFVAVALAVSVAALATPQAAHADGHWLDEIDFEPAEPTPGRRLYFEGLRVSENRAEVALRAATGLKLRVRSQRLFFGTASLEEGERISYSLPLSGESPSLTFSWEDTLGQAGAFTIEGAQLPHPLPIVEGELCDLRVVSLGWSPGAVSGAVEPDCEAAVQEQIELQTVAGHESVTETALVDAEVTAIAGNVVAAAGASQVRVPFTPDGEILFSVPVTTVEAIHPVTLNVNIEASLNIPMPPLVVLTHRPERTERRTETVSLLRRGASRTVSETVTVDHEDGTQTEHVVTATLSIPSETVRRNVTVAVVHPERVEAEIVELEPITLLRTESLSLSLSIGSDDPFTLFASPEPEPEPESAEQVPLTDGEAGELFDLWGWEWPW